MNSQPRWFINNAESLILKTYLYGSFFGHKLTLTVRKPQADLLACLETEVWLLLAEVSDLTQALANGPCDLTSAVLRVFFSQEAVKSFSCVVPFNRVEMLSLWYQRTPGVERLRIRSTKETGR